MHPLPEREVPVRLPRAVERLGIRELSVVPVGGGEDCVHEFPAGSLFASKLRASRVDRPPHGVEARAVPLPECLLLEQLERVWPHVSDLLNPPQPHGERGVGAPGHRPRPDGRRRPRRLPPR